MYPLKPEQCVATFGSKDQLSGHDIQRNWNDTIVEFFDSATKTAHIIRPLDIGTAYVKGPEWVNGEFGEDRKIPTKNAYVIREGPRGGAVKYGDAIFWVQKNARRQWVRGASTHNHSIKQLFPINMNEIVNGESFFKVLAQAFNQTYKTPEEFSRFVRKEEWPESFVVTPAVWGIAKDQTTMSLFDEDLFIGILDRNMFLISVEETSTIVEDFFNEYKLQSV